MYEAVPDHLVLALEAFTAFTPRTVFHWTVMWPILTVYIRMRAVAQVSICLRYPCRKLKVQGCDTSTGIVFGTALHCSLGIRTCSLPAG